jgi:transposase
VIREKEAYESQLLALIEKFKRMAFAQKRERFEGNRDQMVLLFEAAPEEVREQRQDFEQKIEYIRTKKTSAQYFKILD